MTAEGYKKQPLSDDLERRIRQRIAQYREKSSTAHQAGRIYEGSINDGAVAALEWLLYEAETLKAEQLRYQPRTTRYDACPDCGHVHDAPDECGFPIGGGRKCLCERQVRA